MATSNEDKKNRDRRLTNSEEANDRKIETLLAHGQTPKPAAQHLAAKIQTWRTSRYTKRLRSEPIPELKPKVTARTTRKQAFT